MEDLLTELVGVVLEVVLEMVWIILSPIFEALWWLLRRLFGKNPGPFRLRRRAIFQRFVPPPIGLPDEPDAFEQGDEPDALIDQAPLPRPMPGRRYYLRPQRPSPRQRARLLRRSPPEEPTAN